MIINKIKNLFRSKYCFMNIHKEDFKIDYMINELYRMDNNSYCKILDAYICLLEDKSFIVGAENDKHILKYISNGIKENNIQIEINYEITTNESTNVYVIFSMIKNGVKKRQGYALTMDRSDKY